MKKPTKPQLYAEVERLQVENLRLKVELEVSKAEVSRLKFVLGKVWQSRRVARFWLEDAREEVGRLMADLLRRI